jgi:hypothetical protein
VAGPNANHLPQGTIGATGFVEKRPRFRRMFQRAMKEFFNASV